MKPNFQKYQDQLIPAIVQDANTKNVLMLGFFNQEALDITLKTNKVTFFSRTKNRIWTKGEESGNFLDLVSINLDCDNDTFLIQANPIGPVCHTGADTCWNQNNESSNDFLFQLEKIIQNRLQNPNQNSYVSSLLQKGINKIAQKVGEEAVEVVIEAKDNNPDLFLNESADLLFHLLILLNAKGHNLTQVIQILSDRNK